jgi:hypothetical protein
VATYTGKTPLTADSRVWHDRGKDHRFPPPKRTNSKFALVNDNADAAVMQTFRTVTHCAPIAKTCGYRAPSHHRAANPRRTRPTR